MIEKTTLEQVTSAIQSYFKIQQELSRLEMTRQLLKESLITYWKEMGCPPAGYKTPDGLKFLIIPKPREGINVEEARALLPQNLFDKLLKVTEFEQVSVRKIKGEDDALLFGKGWLL